MTSQPRKVCFAKLHEAFQQPGINGLSTLGKTLVASQQPGIVMFYTAEGLEVNWKGYDFIVPLANIAGVTFEKIKTKAACVYAESSKSS